MGLTRCIQEQKVSSTGIVQLLRLCEVRIQDGCCDGGRVALIIGVTDVIDTEPESEERIVAAPVRCVTWCWREIADECGGLVHEGLDGVLVRGHQGRIDNSTAIGKVVRQRERGVVGCNQEIEPVKTVIRSVAWEGWVAYRVIGRGLGGVDVETSLGV